MTEQTESTGDPKGFVEVIAKNVRRLAFEADLTIADLANAIDLRQPALSKRLNGTVEWSLSDLLAVARHFGVPLSTLAPDSLTNDALR